MNLCCLNNISTPDNRLVPADSYNEQLFSTAQSLSVIYFLGYPPRGVLQQNKEKNYQIPWLNALQKLVGKL